MALLKDIRQLSLHEKRFKFCHKMLSFGMSPKMEQNADSVLQSSNMSGGMQVQDQVLQGRNQLIYELKRKCRLNCLMQAAQPAGKEGTVTDIQTQNNLSVDSIP